MTTHLAHQRSTGDQLILEQAEWFLLHHAHVEHLDRGTYDDDRNRLWRMAQTAAVQGFTVLYLLAVLRDLDPDIADRAARMLRDTAGWGDEAEIPARVEAWMRAVAAGDDCSPPLAPVAVPTPRPAPIPSGDPA